MPANVQAAVARVPDPIKALEEVGRLFYMEREVELPSGHKCKLAPLGAAQEAKANARVQDFRAIHFLKAVKVEQLAYAIIEVDGARFDRPVKSDGSFDEALYEDQVSAKRSILNAWPDGVVTYLFNELCILQDEVEAKVGVQVKTELPLESPATEADTQSVADST